MEIRNIDVMGTVSKKYQVLWKLCTIAHRDVSRNIMFSDLELYPWS